jgi:predicted HTH domain antitoxin
MQITIDIPDEVGQRLDGKSKHIERIVLEVLVADVYSSGGLSTAEVGRILGLSSRLETHAFLKRMGVYLNYDDAELERDIQTLRELRA